jgi:hypothetical protein
MDRFPFLARYGAALAFAVLAFFGGWAIKTAGDANDLKMRDSQVSGCVRTNVLRSTLADFLASAAKARRDEGNEAVAVSYEQQRLRLVRAVHPQSDDPYGPVVVNCDRAFPKP